MQSPMRKVAWFQCLSCQLTLTWGHVDRNMLNDPSSCKVAPLDRVTFQYQVTKNKRQRGAENTSRTSWNCLHSQYRINLSHKKILLRYLILRTILNDSHVSRTSIFYLGCNPCYIDRQSLHCKQESTPRALSFTVYWKCAQSISRLTPCWPNDAGKTIWQSVSSVSWKPACSGD